MPRWGAALAYSSIEERIYVFGGSNNQKGHCGNDVWSLDMRTWNFEE